MVVRFNDAEAIAASHALQKHLREITSDRATALASVDKRASILHALMKINVAFVEEGYIKTPLEGMIVWGLD